MPHSAFIQPAGFWLKRAEIAMEKEEFLHAAVFYRHALSLPDCPDSAGRKYAFLLHRMGQIFPALLECLHMAAKNPHHFNAQAVLCMTLVDLGLDQEASDVYHAHFYPVNGLASRFAKPKGRGFRFLRSHSRLRDRGLYRRAFACLDSGNRKRAGKALSILRRYGVRSPERFCLEACLTEIGSACFSFSQSAAKMAGDQPALMLRCAKALYRFSKKEAFRFVLRAATYASSVKELRMLCSLCRNMELPHIAAAALRRELEIFPSRADALYDLSVFLCEHGQREEALTLAEKLVLANPEEPAFLWLRKTLLTASPEKPIFPLYGERNYALEKEHLIWLEDCLHHQEPPFSAAPLHFRQNQQKLLYLFSGALDADSALSVLRTLIATQPTEIACIFLRYYLLFRPQPLGLNRAVKLLAALAPPPYFVHRGDRVLSVMPDHFQGKRQQLLEKQLPKRTAMYENALNLGLRLFFHALLPHFTRREKLHMACGDPRLWLRAFCREVGKFTKRPRPAIALPAGKTERSIFLLYSSHVRNALNRQYHTHRKERSEPPHESH